MMGDSDGSAGRRSDEGQDRSFICGDFEWRAVCWKLHQRNVYLTSINHRGLCHLRSPRHALADGQWSQKTTLVAGIGRATGELSTSSWLLADFNKDALVLSENRQNAERGKVEK